jgi:hypothetical protein
VLLASACGVDRALEAAPVFPESSTIGYAHGARLVHEVGHVVVGDMEHLDPRWEESTAHEHDACAR